MCLFQQRMNILVLGDEHTYGYGLSGGNLSYIGHLMRQLGRVGQQVSVEAYAHLTLCERMTLLAQLPLSRYDLILLQSDSQFLESCHPTTPAKTGTFMPILSLPCQDATPNVWSGKGLSNQINAMGKFLNYLSKPRRSRGLVQLLQQLRPYRHNVVLITPLPHRQGIQSWLRNRTRTLVMREADRQSFSVFDANWVLQPKEEYFLTNDSAHLNAVSHELLGHSLFDYYQSAPTIVTVQSKNRNQSNY